MLTVLFIWILFYFILLYFFKISNFGAANLNDSIALFAKTLSSDEQIYLAISILVINAAFVVFALICYYKDFDPVLDRLKIEYSIIRHKWRKYI